MSEPLHVDTVCAESCAGLRSIACQSIELRSRVELDSSSVTAPADS